MNTAPDLTTPTANAAPAPTSADVVPRIKLPSNGFSIDHPDTELGEQLMANALGVADREAMDGILRQLVRASVNGGSHDEVNHRCRRTAARSAAYWPGSCFDRMVLS